MTRRGLSPAPAASKCTIRRLSSIDRTLAAIAQPMRMRPLVPESDLPSRYQVPWRPSFVGQVLEHCSPGITILDVGGGAKPTLPREVRPPGCTYIGLDPDAVNLTKGDYDERFATSAADLCGDLVDRAHLVVSWNALEHVSAMPTALECFHAYLKPRGVLLARLSGRWSTFAIASRVLPHRLRVRLMTQLIGARADDHFQTYYDKCTWRDLNDMLDSWSAHEIVPLYRGAGYLAFSKNAQRLYLAYESVAMRHRQLATHYNLKAVR